MTAELLVLEVLASGWVKDREGPFGEESGGVLMAGGGYGGEGM